MNKRILESILSLSVLQGSNHILNFITLPYLVRILGPDHFGMIAFSQALIQFLILLTDYGFNLSATRIASTIRNDIYKLSELFWSVILIKIFLLFLSALILLGLLIFFPFFFALLETSYNCIFDGYWTSLVSNLVFSRH